MRRKKQRSGLCPRCKKSRKLEAHHIFPKQHFGKGKMENPFILFLCHDCHAGIGQYVHYKPKMSVEQYARIAWDFVQRRRMSI